jgi:UDPglucose 6-dehydrogenase
MILVLGLGYVGLTTAIGFASKKNRVTGYDVDARKAARIQAGHVPFLEPGMDKALGAALKNGSFSITSDMASAVRQAKVIMICVGTPSVATGVDLTYINQAIEEVLRHVNGRKVIVIRSTVPPGTACGEITRFIECKGYRVGRDIGLVTNPEFLREGCAWDDFLNGNRIVIGGSDKKSISAVRTIYRHFSGEIFEVSLTTAEFIKYLSNTLLATMVSFSNEMATFAERLGGIDIPKAFRIVHLDGRWKGRPAAMASYVYPGCGFGGACLPKDTLAMLRRAESQKQPMPLLKAVLEVNARRPVDVLAQIRRRMNGKVSGKKVTVLGLAFKPHTDDVRHSPALPIIKGLLEDGARVTAFDPVAMENFKESGLKLKYAASLKEALKGAQYVVITTAWPEFKKVFALLPEERIIDGRFMSVPKSARGCK